MRDRNAYMREYLRKRWKARKEVAMDHLGGVCVRCGTKENLAFDHIDPTTKYQQVSRMSTASEERFWNEVAKCQLLCTECHRLKTLDDLGQKDARKMHGTLSSYKYCHCALCRAANAAWSRQYKLQRKFDSLRVYHFKETTC